MKMNIVEQNSKKVTFFDFANTIAKGYFVGPFNLYFAEHYIRDRYKEIVESDNRLKDRISK